MPESKNIWTIGHSNQNIYSFIATLISFEIKVLADIRRFPVSKRYPQFNKKELADVLEKIGIEYRHLEDLGGKLKEGQGSYIDYMQTLQFREEAKHLEEIAREKRTAFMCAEANWRNCHRAHLSDYLKARDWEVVHILGEKKSEEHPLQQPKTQQGSLFF